MAHPYRRDQNACCHFCAHTRKSSNSFVGAAEWTHSPTPELAHTEFRLQAARGAISVTQLLDDELLRCVLVEDACWRFAMDDLRAPASAVGSNAHTPLDDRAARIVLLRERKPGGLLRAPMR